MGTKTQTLTLNLIQSAQRGDRDCQSRLAELIRPKVYAYCYRMTLDTHGAEDLCQETMVSLVQNLGQLTIKAPSYLWAWVYKTALNQIRDNYHHQRVIQNGITDMKQTLPHGMREGRISPSGPEPVVHQELLSAVSRAIETLKLQYRNILTLRCFQELSYAEIAQVMGNSELGARMLFFRAKQSLTRQLARDGFKKSQLLPGLTLFAAATLAPSEPAAAATVSTAVIHTGLIIKLLTVLSTTKVGLGIAAVCALSLIPLGLSFTEDNDSTGQFHLVPESEVTQTNLAYPASVRQAYDPDQSGWQGALMSEDHTDRAHRPVPITLDQWLTNPTGPSTTWLHLPQDHWVEVTFNADIVDGEGDDIFVTERCCHGEKAEVYLVDENGRTTLLGALQVPSTREHAVVTYGFDLATLSKPFSATVVRIKCTDNGLYEFRTAIPGMELLHVRVKTR